NAEAADAFRQAATLDPQNAVAWLNAGLLYAQTGAGAKAIPALSQALTLGTDYKYEAHMALAQVYVAAKNTHKAMTEFTAASSARPDDPTALFDLAVLQTQAGQTAVAEQTYRKVLAAAPTDPQILAQAQTNLGLLLAADGKSAEAMPLLQAAAQSDPKNAAPHLALANLYARAGDAAKAMAERQTAVILNPQDTQTRLLVADALLADKKYAEAAMQYEAVIKRDPGNAAVQNALGTAYEQMNDLTRAQAAFKSALTGKGSAREKAQAQNNLGVVYEKQGKQAQAIAAYKKAVALDPMLTEAKTNLARFRK
nr:tetratricopeptide repeat protein [Armatimonadota bacterium]